MRVVLLHHFPLQQDTTGRLVRQWAADLRAAGHEVRLMVVDTAEAAVQGDGDRIVCGAGNMAADLPFDLPGFRSGGGQAASWAFTDLSDEQLSLYRDRQRQRLDTIIAEFDPHVIHSQHVWVQGQLALESGVPYVLNAWGVELEECRRDPRYRTLAAQAAENAGRILVVEPRLASEVVELFEITPDRLLVMPAFWTSSDAGQEASATRGAALADLYETIYDERFGPLA